MSSSSMSKSLLALVLLFVSGSVLAQNIVEKLNSEGYKMSDAAYEPFDHVHFNLYVTFKNHSGQKQEFWAELIGSFDGNSLTRIKTIKRSDRAINNDDWKAIMKAAKDYPGLKQI